MHKIGLKILLGWALLLPITAYSLGLGDIDVKSFLNQPLNAEISIISARPGEIDDLLVGLANRDAFVRASLSRPSHLSDLKFKVVKSDDGESATISVKTQTAVKEPVLNFLVEADWSKGKVFREFTILLDPPYFAQQAAQSTPKLKTAPKKITPVEPPQNTVKQPEAIVNQEPEQDEVTVSNDEYVNESAITEEYSFDVSSVEAAPIENSENEESYSSSSSESITIADGATLWSVAKTLKTDNVSMSQIMLALQRVNQDAFGRDNINNLKQGAVLRVPTQQDMADLSQRDAYVEVLNQNGLWNDYLASVGRATANSSNTQLDSSNTSNEASNDEANNSELSIVTADEGMSDKAALQSDEAVEQVTTLRKQLLLSEEEAESLKVERDELSARVKMLESELDKRSELENLVSIEDDSLATMEQTLANNETTEESTMEMTDDVMANEQSDAPSDDGMMNEEGVVSSEEVIGDEPVMIEENESSNEMDSVDSMTNEMAEPESNNELPTVTQPPIIVSETESSSGFLDAVMSNPLVQGAIAVILLLVLLAVKFVKGRKDKAAKVDKSESIEDVLSEDPIDTQSGIIIPNVDDEDETPINVPQMEENQPVDDFTSTVSTVNATDDEEDEFSKTAIINADDVPSMEEDSSDEDGEQDETLDEVDVYLAYSLFDNAEELLKEKLADSPDRADYRAKLLDTYFATKNKDAFNDEASSLKNLGGKADKYWPRVQTMGFELDPSNNMFAEGEGGDISDLAIAKPEMADFDIGADGDDSAEVSDFDLSLDGDDTNFDLSEDSDDSEIEFNLDDELSLNNNDTDELPDDLGGLDFDLDDSDEGLESNAVDDGLEFDLSDDLSTEAATETVVLDLDDDILDISVDDIDPDLNDDSLDLDLDDSEISLETTGTFNALEDDLPAEEEMLDTVSMPSIENDVIDLNFDEETDDLNIDLEDDSEELSISSDGIDLNLNEGDDLNLDLEDDSEEIEIIDLDVSDELDVNVSEDNDVLDDSNVEMEETEIVSALDVDIDGLEDDSDDELVIPDIEIDDIGDLDSVDDLDDLDDITDIGNIEGLMLPDDVDEVATKLDLAKAFHDMGDSEGARSSLEEVLEEGNDEQKAEAQALLNEIAD